MTSETVCRDKNVRKCSLSLNKSIYRTVESNLEEQQ